VYCSKLFDSDATLIVIWDNATVDIVILGSVRELTALQGTLLIDLGRANGDATKRIQDPVALGISQYRELGLQVQQCQGMGKNFS
jgi:hypothetical protein